MQNKRIKEKIVVSFTSFPARILCAYKVAKRMLGQTVKADRVVLCLAESQFPGRTLPPQFGTIKDSRFEILWCNDIGPHKKYFYAMKKYPDAIVITVDDDIDYPDNVLARLLRSYTQHPDAVSCLRAHTLRLRGKEFLGYAEWADFSEIVGEPSLLTLPTGSGGVLYPPHILPECAFDTEKLTRISLMTDDLWLKWNELTANVPCVLAENSAELMYIGASQEQSLWHDNADGGRNDANWRAITRAYMAENAAGYDRIISALSDEYERRFVLPRKMYLDEVAKGGAKPAISVVMPVYNSEKYLAQAIDSVLGQTLYELELICVDDGSADGSADIIRRYMARDARVKLVQQANMYAGCARNNGLQHASGDYVYFMDSDDWLELTAFEQIYALVKNGRDDILVFFHYVNNVETGEEKISPRYYGGHRAYRGVFRTTFAEAPWHFIYNTVVPWNKIYRREFLTKNGFRFSPLQSANDRSFYFETVSRADSILIYNNFLLHYRTGNSRSVSSSLRLKNFGVHFTSMKEVSERCAWLKEDIRLMLTDACMRDMFDNFSRAGGRQKVHAWRCMEQGFATLDIPYSDAAVNEKYFGWYGDYRAIKENATAEEPVTIAFSARRGNISSACACATTLLMQSLHGCRVVLWLPVTEFADGKASLPAELTELEAEGLEIKFTEDYGEYTEVIASLKYIGGTVICVGEMREYGFGMAKELYAAHRKNGGCICAAQGGRVFRTGGGRLVEVCGGTFNDDIMNKPNISYPVLYPHGSLHRGVFGLRREDAHDKSVWLWGMGVLAGSRVHLCGSNPGFFVSDIAPAAEPLIEEYPYFCDAIVVRTREEELKACAAAVDRGCAQKKTELSVLRKYRTRLKLRANRVWRVIIEPFTKAGKFFSYWHKFGLRKTMKIVFRFIKNNFKGTN